MPRIARRYSNTEVYHIIFRGNDKQDIFYDDKDKNVFLKMLKETKKKYKLEIYSYCLMSNHVHIVIRVKNEFLSGSMKSLGTRYSKYFNTKLIRSGHLFENRFFSSEVENLSYFLQVCKYIHRNPEKAKMDTTEKYKWSSYQEYVGNKNKIIDKKVLLNYFDNNIDKFKKYTLQNDDIESLNRLAVFEIKNKLDDEDLDKILIEKYKLKFSTDVVNLCIKDKDEILLYLKEVTGTNINQISRVTRVKRYYIEELYKKV